GIPNLRRRDDQRRDHGRRRSRLPRLQRRVPGRPRVAGRRVHGGADPGHRPRTYPSSLAGPLYPDGIPIVPESRLYDLIADNDVDEIVCAYSDLSHDEVMHKASLALASGADFRLLGPRATML